MLPQRSDTKGDEIFVSVNWIQRQPACAKDCGFNHKTGRLTRKRMSAPAASPPVTWRERVFCGDRGRAQQWRQCIVFERCSLAKQINDIAALLGLGGSGGTALITPAKSPPVGIPKPWFPPLASRYFHYIASELRCFTCH